MKSPSHPSWLTPGFSDSMFSIILFSSLPEDFLFTLFLVISPNYLVERSLVSQPSFSETRISTFSIIPLFLTSIFIYIYSSVSSIFYPLNSPFEALFIIEKSLLVSEKYPERFLLPFCHIFSACRAKSLSKGLVKNLISPHLSKII